ncbi:hypothetical protein Aduo_013855 [Ancylostoma duodenale]
MARLYFLAIAAASLLPHLCQGTSMCTGGDVDQSEANDVLKLINDRRKKLVDGTQEKGRSGKKLPAAKGMTAINGSGQARSQTQTGNRPEAVKPFRTDLSVFSFENKAENGRVKMRCELENDAKEGLKNHSCDEEFPPTDPKGRARLFMSDYDNYADPDISTFIKTNLDFIDNFALEDVTNTSVKYKEEGFTYLYSQAMRATTTEIGCTLKRCKIGGFDMFAAYCLTNQPTLKNGEVIYEVGKAGECMDCPAGTTCDPNNKLCVTVTTTTTTTTAKTTTGATPAPTTAIPPSSGAGFPTSE